MREGPTRKTLYTSVVTLRLMRVLARRPADPAQHGEGRAVARALRALALLELAADRGAQVVVRERDGREATLDVEGI